MMDDPIEDMAEFETLDYDAPPEPKPYSAGRLKTPGGRWLPVQVIDRKHQIRGLSGFKVHVPLLDRSGIHFTGMCIREFIDHKRNCNILVTGDPGLGKSTVISHVALDIDPKFDVDKISFWLKDFEDTFRRNPFGDGDAGVYPQNDMDETAHAMYGPEYQKEEQRVVAKNMIISRIKRNIIWFAAPKRKLLNPHVREMVNVWIHVTEPKPFLPGYARVRFAPPEKQSEFYTEKFWEPKYAFIFPEMTGPYWERYESKKIAFLEEASVKKPSSDVDDIMNTVVKNLRKLHMSQTEIAKIIEKNQSTVSRIESRFLDPLPSTTNNNMSA